MLIKKFLNLFKPKVKELPPPVDDVILDETVEDKIIEDKKEDLGLRFNLLQFDEEGRICAASQERSEYLTYNNHPVYMNHENIVVRAHEYVIQFPYIHVKKYFTIAESAKLETGYLQ